MIQVRFSSSEAKAFMGQSESHISWVEEQGCTSGTASFTLAIKHLYHELLDTSAYSFCRELAEQSVPYFVPIPTHAYIAHPHLIPFTTMPLVLDDCSQKCVHLIFVVCSFCPSSFSPTPHLAPSYKDELSQCGQGSRQ